MIISVNNVVKLRNYMVSSRNRANLSIKNNVCFYVLGLIGGGSSHVDRIYEDTSWE